MITTPEVTPPTPTALAVDAAGAIRDIFPGCWSLRTWRRMDSSGQIPRGFAVSGRKLWRTADLRRWSEWGFPSRQDFEARVKAEGGDNERPK